MADEEKDEQTEDGGVTVEVAPDKGKPELTDEEVEKMAELPAEDEIGRYAKDAQKRIKSLHISNQEWRRRVAQANKDVATATSLAEQLYQENQSLRSNVGRSEAALIDQAIQRAESQLAQAKLGARAAFASQDPDAIVTANEMVARFVSEVDRLKLLKPTAEAPPPAGEAPPQPQAQPPQPAQRPVSEGVKKWISKNSWFGKPGEEEITNFALGVHQSLERQGITEEGDPDQYWSTINRRLREVYPKRFQEAAPAGEKPAESEGGRRPVTVTGATRTATTPNGGSKRHVVLTESQVRIAKSLGITNEQYAAQLVKESKPEPNRGPIQ